MYCMCWVEIPVMIGYIVIFYSDFKFILFVIIPTLGGILTNSCKFTKTKRPFVQLVKRWNIVLEGVGKQGEGDMCKKVWM